MKFGKFIINSTQIEESKIDNLSMSILIIYVVQQIHVLQRIRKYLFLEKGELLCKVFINSQFNYAPLVRIFCRKKQYLKIPKIHNKALKVVYNSNKNCHELLGDNDEISVRQRHLCASIWEVFKS